MIIVNQVSKGFGTRTLFDNVSVKFTPGNRYGLTGPNGAGKSTFMKILTGEVEPSNAGTVVRPTKVGVLKQDQFAFDNERIIDTVVMGNEILWQAFQERDSLCAKENLSEEEMNRLGELEVIIADENGYSAEIEAAEILRGIGLADDKHEDLMKSLPTDYKFRVLLAQALFGEPQALLLDEPTNHLDLDSIHWLEEFLCTYEGTLVVISHDRHFLNAVTTHIADIDYDTIIIYTGNYDDMVAQKVQARQTIESANRDKAKKIAQLQEFVARFAAGQRSSQVQSRKKEIARLAPQELKKSNIQRPFIRFEQEKPSGKEVLIVRGLSKGFDDKPLFQGLDLEVMRGDKVAIIGANGVGKTTLLRTLIGEIAPDEGTIKWTDSASWSYYPQDYHEEIKPGSTVLDWLMQFMVDEGQQYVRGVLGRMLFSGDESLKATDALSGGEAARLLMSRMMMLKNPVLIFDEPTNHLDLEAVSALGEGLAQFPGTVFVVTHDRDLVSNVATRILSFKEDGLINFAGTYEEYLQDYPQKELARRPR
ncbi:MAG: ATP-binding cassette domain-containing protein [Candidatus Obscuribacter phosphatis]|uniref:ATP-binding cassette domain-containing protein n=1 Tax=Candidatus Obscuribacter phosphatis TaxID=1906157 RepID=A0A8J7PFF9_9BACT|nr:ATP-binding cassette domain-containing protein [Candidatus Obscuribacter phosphatis]